MLRIVMNFEAYEWGLRVATHFKMVDVMDADLHQVTAADICKEMKRLQKAGFDKLQSQPHCIRAALTMKDVVIEELSEKSAVGHKDILRPAS